MEAMKPLDRATVIEILEHADAPVILVHKKPDGDALGSAAALAHYLIAKGKRVSVDCADPIPERLKFALAGLDLAPADRQDATRTVISLDVASPAQLGALADIYVGDLAPALMIDHHAVGTPFAPHWIIPDASSTGEVLYDLLFPYDGGRKCEIATALYTAISSDTGCFKFANVEPSTHTAAANLLACGIDAASVNRHLFDSKSYEQLRAEATALARLSMCESGRIAYAALYRSDIDPIGEEYFETAIDIVRSLAGVEIALVLKEQANGDIRGSMRSIGADVASIAMQFGGGGHVRAAGFTLTNCSMQEAIDTTLTKLKGIL